MYEFTLRVFADDEDLNDAAAAWIAATAQMAVHTQGRFLIALSGGGTPEPLYRRLSRAPYPDIIPWDETIVLWGDERLVPPDEQGSNYKQAHELLLSHVPIPPDQIIRVQGEADPDTAVAHYTEQLRQLAPPGRQWPRLHIGIMGLGADGHTASLFPGSDIDEEKPVTAVTADYDDRPAHRLTLTPPVFNDAFHLLFLVTGERKAEAVQAVLEGEADPQQWPARRIHPPQGSLKWYLNRAAASRLSLMSGR